MMLSLSHVSKTFYSQANEAKKALVDVTLDVAPGDFITIIGANGAGKSTLFNAIAGTFIADSGTILLDGRDISLMPEHRRAREIGRLFQDPMPISRADRALFRERVALLDMGLEDRMHQQVGLLSGGQRQALTLMMATINPPKLLLLDEHTAALDPATAEKVLALTASLVREQKLTCLMITHNMQSALELGNRTIMMNHGQIVMDIAGEAREHTTVSDLLTRFKEISGRALDNDRMLLI